MIDRGRSTRTETFLEVPAPAPADAEAVERCLLARDLLLPPIPKNEEVCFSVVDIVLSQAAVSDSGTAMPKSCAS
jgi:hypothetical protein